MYMGVTGGVYSTGGYGCMVEDEGGGWWGRGGSLYHGSYTNIYT